MSSRDKLFSSILFLYLVFSPILRHYNVQSKQWSSFLWESQRGCVTSERTKRAQWQTSLSPWHHMEKVTEGRWWWSKQPGGIPPLFPLDCGKRAFCFFPSVAKEANKTDERTSRRQGWLRWRSHDLGGSKQRETDRDARFTHQSINLSVSHSSFISIETKLQLNCHQGGHGGATLRFSIFSLNYRQKQRKVGQFPLDISGDGINLNVELLTHRWLLWHHPTQKKKGWKSVSGPTELCLESRAITRQSSDNET